FGHAGCFSFQNSKHLPIGEGGAIVSDDEEFMDRCYSYHNFGASYGSVQGKGIPRVGHKFRTTEYQAAIGLAQLKRLQSQSEQRFTNGDYLRQKMKELPGIRPVEYNDGVTRAVFHLYPFRYIKDEFKGLPRERFIRAMSAEGIPCGNGYGTYNKQDFIKDALNWKLFKKVYPPEMLDYNKYMEQNQCPENDILCDEEAIWMAQSMLLTSKSDMDDIVKAIQKIYEHADKIKEKS
ncbi:DegT/DnrJ/EryC1/StrS family aminotransferase, partial [Bacteroidota bacterium]